MHTQRFLIVKIAALGDIAVASVLLNRIRAEYPNAHVTWLCGNGGAHLVRLFPGVDEVLTVDEKLLLRGNLFERVGQLVSVWQKLIGRHFDRALVVHADWRYRALVPMIPGRRVSALRHGANPLLDRFRGDEYARLLDGPESRGPITTRYELSDVRDRLPSAAASVGRARVAIVAGGARNVLRDDALRRWPIESYRAVAAELAAAGHEVVLMGDEGDVGLRRHFSGIPCTDLVGQLALVDALCVLRDVDVLVTHDTGPLHLARLVRTPVVALFGPTDPRHVVGQADDVDTLWGGADLACRPCYDGRDYAACSNNLCIKSVSVEMVLTAVSKRLTAATIPESAAGIA